MMALIQGVSKIYSLLLGLFPRDFRNEFKEEMEDVFTVSLEEASKIGAALVVRACFFELFDLPVNLVVEHLSNLRKGNVMKTLSYEVGRMRAVLMAALGMSVGWILINWLGLVIHIRPFDLLPLPMILYSLPVILCGLMLGIAAGLRISAFLRIGLCTIAGGMLGHLATLPVRMANEGILARIGEFPGWEGEIISLLGLVAVMCIYGLFYGAGLGFAFGGWKTCLKFALIGLVANAVGMLAGYYIVLGLQRSGFLGSLGFPIFPISYLTWSIMGALSGGIMGWFFGKESQPEAGPVMRTGNA